jgi:hypothetical protein
MQAAEQVNGNVNGRTSSPRWMESSWMNRISGQSRMLIAVAMCLRTYLRHSTCCVDRLIMEQNLSTPNKPVLSQYMGVPMATPSFVYTWADQLTCQQL